MFFFRKTILSLFVSDEAALEIAMQYLSIMALCLPVLYVLHITKCCIQGLGNTVLPMISGVAEFFMRTFAAFYLPVAFGENGIMFAEVLAWLGADLILIPSYLYVMKKIKMKAGNERG